jgi:hypothetical protein
VPEYLSPGVYVEEISFSRKPIEGVSTTTTGFVGASRYGPVDLEPQIVTSLAEFERAYGDGRQLEFSGPVATDNFLWHAARAFFAEGGKRLYVARVFRPLLAQGQSESDLLTYKRPPADITADDPGAPGLPHTDGHARCWLPGVPSGDRGRHILVRARFPGAAGNMRVRFTVRLGGSVLSGAAGSVTAAGLREFDTVWLGKVSSPADGPPGRGGTYVARFDEADQTWRFTQAASSAAATQGPDVWLNAGSDPARTTLDPANGDELRLLTLTVTVTSADGGSSGVWDNVAPDRNHKSAAGSPDGLSSLFRQEPNTTTEARTLPIVVLAGAGLDTGRGVLEALVNSGINPGLVAGIADPGSSDAERSVEFLLAGGNDGRRPTAAEYEGAADPDTNARTGLKLLEDLEDISIVAVPGSTDGYGDPARKTQADATLRLLIAHAERMRYRIAVLDSGEGQSISEVREMRAKLDSSYAALYYPWVRVVDPVTNTERNLPPSGFVAGIYARNDLNRAVYKAPANEVVNLAVGFEKMLDRAEQEVLNPEGVNCFRYFEGLGHRLWGARTISSDPEWKYVNLRRYFAYLERSIDKGTQWVVFEPNGQPLWGNVRSAISDFLLNEWRTGALHGDKPEKAFFVRCDRSTMTQNDLDNGRLVCLVGVAPLRPAEFVIVRIGQWTADRKV